MTDRQALTQARRVVVKVGSSSLTSSDGGIAPDRIALLVDALANLRASGKEVVLISSGAVAAGYPRLGLPSRPRDLAGQQAAASVGQGLLMAQYGEQFGRHGLTTGQVLLTVDDLTRLSSYRNATRTLGRLLQLGVVPVVNENDTVATHEIRFGDNDRLGALVAQAVRSDVLVLLSDVDALYTAHPCSPGAARIARVPDIDELDVDTSRGGSHVGTGGMTTKLQAAQIATSVGIPTLLAAADQAARALAGDPEIGTWFDPAGKRRPRRLLWLAHASHVRGRLLLDHGAVSALAHRGASLLAAGVTAVEGDFAAGDPVELVGPDGRIVGRGLVAFSSEELPAMLGKKTAELAETLGAQYEREVVHRDQLMLNRRRA
ncbi:glutamate 5-kinase [Aestuariimicrobium sp. T2.26MG-19.2B]|uniref:glutamate 5-kinase n=1 Tax=Aestuariimicrobium sp. T2.26MG-19.2B TaxID=3040679 RepID=UPI00253FA77B|nr:glutamate 5-kinase [Aestuariimicrobium sp. T2.26MG-19.2B]